MMTFWPVYYLITVAAVSADILEGPENGSFPAGSNVTLPCIVEGKPDKTFWIDDIEITPIFYNREKVGSGEKYENFYLGSSSYTDFSLYILNANVTDEGRYTCRAGDERRTATITIEAPPTLSLSINGSWYEKDGGTLKQNSTRSVTISCTAIRAKPAVKLRLKINDGQWIEQLDTYITQKDVYFDSYISHGHMLSRTDVSVTCQAFGQTSITSTNITKAFYLPKCEITLVAEDVICSCDAFPPVYKYVIVIDGKSAKEADRITVVDYPHAEYTCLGTNYLGTTQTKPISTSDHSDRKGFGAVAIGVVSLTVIILLGIGVSLTLYLRKRKQHVTYAGLPKDEKLNLETEKEIPSEMKDLFSKVAPLIKVDLAIFAIDDLKLPKELILYIIENEDNRQGQVELVLKKWFAYCKKEPKEEQLLQIMRTSDVCLDFHCNMCFEVFEEETVHMLTDTKHFSGEDIPNKGRTSPRPILKNSREMFLMFESVGSLIGNTGATRLAEKYNLNWKGENCHQPGTDVLAELTERKRLEDSDHSMELFLLNLYECHLYRALKAADDCSKKDLENFIDIMSDKIIFDWELFAIGDLGLDTTTVERLSKCKILQDQISAVLRCWTETRNEACPKYKLVDCMIQSSVCKDPSNNRCVEMLQNVSDFEAFPKKENPDKILVEYGETNYDWNYGFECFRAAFLVVIASIQEEENYKSIKALVQGNTQSQTTLIEKLKERHPELAGRLLEANQQLKILPGRKEKDVAVINAGSFDMNSNEHGEDKSDSAKNVSQNWSFYEMLWKISNIVGRKGTTQILATYGFRRNDPCYAYECGRPLCIVLAKLISDKKLRKEKSSLEQLETVLSNCNLFRARDIVHAYTT